MEKTRYILNLYVLGEHPHTDTMLVELRDALDGHDCHLEVIDVADDPDRAREANVFATPTLVRAFPQPSKRLIGDLRDAQNCLTVLGILPKDATGHV